MYDPIAVPDVEISLSGAPPADPLHRSLKRDLIDVSIDEHIDKTTEFSLGITAWDSDRSRYAWVDDPSLALGTRLGIALGYAGRLESLVVGDLFDLELQFSQGEPPTLVLRGQDLRHALGRQETVKSFVQMTDFEIASALVRETLGVSLQGENNGPKSDTVIKAGVSDLAYLYALAKANACVFVARGRHLFFKSLNLEANPALTLSPEKDLISFSSSVNNQDRVGKLLVRGTVADGTEPVEQEASLSGRRSGLLPEDKVHTELTRKIEDPLLKGEGAVKQRLRAEAMQLTEGYLTAHCTCFGNTALRVGEVVKIEGVGRRFSQKYLIIAAKHSFSVSSGYRTTIEVRGNTWKP